MMQTNKIKIVLESDASTTVNAVKSVTNEFNSLNNAADTAAKHFRSLTTEILSIAGVVGIADAFKKAISASYDYNKTIEASRLGIAAIVTSMTDMSDMQGHLIQGAQKFGVATKIAVAAQQELQKISQNTVATYQELVEVYQGILAPALSAKMTFRETLEITGLLTNAVRAIGLPIQQIKQEARDLIQGGIQPASSSLATALGISDAMVKKWRESGDVFKELKSRMEGFAYATAESAKTMEGATSNLKELLQKALGEGGKPLYDYIKSEVLKLTSLIADIKRDNIGNIISISIKPEVIEYIDNISSKIKNLIEDVKLLAQFALKMWNAIGSEAVAAAIIYQIGSMAIKFMELVKAIELATAAAMTFKKTVVGLAIYGGYKIYEQLNIQDQLSTMADNVRKRLAADPKAYIPYVEKIGAAQIEQILKEIPGLTEDQIVRYIQKGLIKISEITHVNKEAIKKEMTSSSDSLDKLLQEYKFKTKAQTLAPAHDKNTNKLLQEIANWLQKIDDLNPALSDTDKKLLELYNTAQKLKNEAIKNNMGNDIIDKINEGLLKGSMHIYDQEEVKIRQKQAEDIMLYEQKITEAKSTELQKRIAAEDKWAQEQYNLLIRAGVDYETRKEKEVEINAIVSERKLKIETDYQQQIMDMQNAHLAALIDIREKSGEITEIQANTARLDLNNRILDSLKEQYDALAGIKGKELERLQLLAKLTEAESVIVELKLKQKLLIGSSDEAIAKGTSNYIKTIRYDYEKWLKLAEDTAKQVEDAFVKMFDNPKAAIADLGNYFANTLKRMAAAALANPIIIPIQQMMMGTFQGVAGVSGLMPTSPTSPTSGGISSSTGLGLGSMVNDLFGFSGTGTMYGGLVGYTDTLAGVVGEEGGLGMSYTATPFGYIAAPIVGYGIGSMFGGQGGIGGAVGGLGGYALGAGGSLLGVELGALGGPIGMVLGSLLGGAIGSLFGDDDYAAVWASVKDGILKHGVWEMPESVHADFAKAINDQMKALSDSLGVSLADVMKTADMPQIEITGDDLASMQTMSKAFWSKFFENYSSAITEQLIGVPISSDYFKQFSKSGEGLGDTIMRIIDAMQMIEPLKDSINDYTDAIMSSYDEIAKFNEQISESNKNIEKLKDSLQAATDPSDAINYANQLKQAIYDRYIKEKQMVESLIQSIDSLEIEHSKFVFSLQGKIDKLTGSANAADAALARMQYAAGRVQYYNGNIDGVRHIAGSGVVNYKASLQWLNEYISGVDDWLAAQTSAIQSRYADLEKTAKEALQHQQDEIRIRQDGIREQLRVIQGWSTLLDNVKQSISELKTGLTNPADVFERLAISKSNLDDIMSRYRSASGDDRVKYAQEALQAQKDYLTIAQEAYQRPSDAYRTIYDNVISGLEEIQNDAQSYAISEESLSAELNRLTEISNNLQQQAVDYSAQMQAELDAINQQAAWYYEWAKTEGSRLYTDAIAEMRDRLASILGDKTVEEYLTDLQLAAVTELVSIRDILTQIRDDLVNGAQQSGLQQPTSSHATDLLSRLQNGDISYMEYMNLLNENNVVDGSHAEGLYRVPFSGYIAKLHKDEMVLTDREAKQYRESKNNETKITISPNITINVSADKDAIDNKKLGMVIVDTIRDSIKYNPEIRRLVRA